MVMFGSWRAQSVLIFFCCFLLHSYCERTAPDASFALEDLTREYLCKPKSFFLILRVCLYLCAYVCSSGLCMCVCVCVCVRARACVCTCEGACTKHFSSNLCHHLGRSTKASWTHTYVQFTCVVNLHSRSFEIGP